MKKSLKKENKNSWVHQWEPRSKIISCLVFIFGLVALETPKLLAVTCLLLVCLLLFIGFSIRKITKKTSYILPFIILMAIPLLVGGGIPPNKERQILVLLLALKGLNSLYLMLIMFDSQPIYELLNSLSHMKLPDFFISILFLSWRYIFLLGEKLRRLQRSLISRLFKPSLKDSSLKTYGQVMGGMLIKSLDTSDKVYKAMSARGFNGTIPTSPPKKIEFLDIVKSITMISIVILLNILEKWWY